jgi:hypothetical protein
MDNYSALTDEALLSAINDNRESRGRLEQEIQHRFEERKTKTITSDDWVASQRQDTEKFVFSKAQLDLFVSAESMGSGQDIANQARQLGRPYVSLRKNKKTETPL